MYALSSSLVEGSIGKHLKTLTISDKVSNNRTSEFTQTYSAENGKKSARGQDDLSSAILIAAEGCLVRSSPD